MQRLRVKGRCLFRAMTKIPSVAERAGAMTGKRHSKVTKMIRDIPHHSNKGAQTSHEKELTDERNLTDRSGWWKDTVKNTPFPGSYHIRDFIEEASLSPVRMTYGFMDSGRNSRIVCMRSGTMLLPGAYSFTDCTQEALRRRASYSFKSCPRPDNYTLGIRDKDIDLSPCHYNVTEKLVPKLPCKHAMFRSATQRLVFLPRTPGPGTYEPSRQISPCFATEDNVDAIHGHFYHNVF